MMTTVTTPIIPINATFAKVNVSHELDLEAICVFSALGFFLDQDTFWKDQIVLSPASHTKLEAKGLVNNSVPWFKWHYTPRAISFNDALDEFSDLFEKIIKEQTQGKNIILPLSGGLDSRTQAVALKRLEANVTSYSYRFENGYNESKIARQIAKQCGFKFEEYTISKGYLWNQIDQLAELNRCYSDFTTPRQMAIYDQFTTMGDVFSLGHWGDVLFDCMNLPELDESQQLEYLLKKIIKRGGLEFASQLWLSWDLTGNFEAYLRSRITELLRKIEIDNTNAKLRAFKSLYWAPRWTSVNLSIFNAHKPITLPYYDDRMCQFICTLPEDFLKNRRLQIEYIKTRAPELSKITWEAQRPFNLTNYRWNKTPYNLPHRVTNKLKRIFNGAIGKSYVQRNWELQFLGNENKNNLKSFLLNSGLDSLIPKPLIEDHFRSFTHFDALQNAHAINMLLTLALFNIKFNHGAKN